MLHELPVGTGSQSLGGNTPPEESAGASRLGREGVYGSWPLLLSLKFLGYDVVMRRVARRRFSGRRDYLPLPVVRHASASDAATLDEPISCQS